jgi:hypothetical protein
MVSTSTVLLAAVACGCAGALGRHIQGGAGPRWVAMVIYTICCLPFAIVYLPDWWVNTLVGMVMIAGFYVNQVEHQDFGTLWGGFMRNSVGLVILAMVTGVPWVLLGIVPVFLVLKWARAAKTPDDPHMYFEYVEGFVYGTAWGTAPIMKGW